jgi:hypothetical protein
MKILTLLAILSVLLFSCQSQSEENKKYEDSVRSDSISKFRLIDSLSKTLKAKNFDIFFHSKYSIDFDTALNTRVFVNHYRVKDIVNENNKRVLKITLKDRFLIRLLANDSTNNVLNEIHNGEKPVLVFDLIKVIKSDTSSQFFIVDGKLLPVN